MNPNHSVHCIRSLNGTIRYSVVFLPVSTPPTPLSFSQPPKFTQAGRLKRNFRLPARYEDVNPEPLRLLELEEDKQPTAVLPCLPLILRNGLRTATNSFGLLQYFTLPHQFLVDSLGIPGIPRDSQGIHLEW